MKRLIRTMFAIGLLSFASAHVLFAQGTPPSTVDDTGVPTNELIAAGVAVASWLLTEGVKKISGKLPRLVVWGLPSLIGIGLTALAGWAGHLHPGLIQTVVSGVLAGALAVWGNEGKTTAAVHGLTGNGS